MPTNIIIKGRYLQITCNVMDLYIRKIIHFEEVPYINHVISNMYRALFYYRREKIDRIVKQLEEIKYDY